MKSFLLSPSSRKKNQFFCVYLQSRRSELTNWIDFAKLYAVTFSQFDRIQELELTFYFERQLWMFTYNSTVLISLFRRKVHPNWTETEKQEHIPNQRLQGPVNILPKRNIYIYIELRQSFWLTNEFKHLYANPVNEHTQIVYIYLSKLILTNGTDILFVRIYSIFVSFISYLDDMISNEWYHIRRSFESTNQ